MVDLCGRQSDSFVTVLSYCVWMSAVLPLHDSDISSTASLYGQYECGTVSTMIQGWSLLAFS